MGKFKDLTGQRIGLLTVLHLTDKTKYKHKSLVWMCQCDCGNTKEISGAQLTQAKSCGCVALHRKETFGQRNIGVTPLHALPLQESTKRTHFAEYKRSAARRSYPFELLEDEFRSLIFQNCYYCDSPPSKLRVDRRRPEGSYLSNGIDRIDNSIGYKMNNCVPCCFVCNRAKDTLTIEEFKIWVKRLVSHLALDSKCDQYKANHTTFKENHE
jgi:hypothetical protein